MWGGNFYHRKYGGVKNIILIQIVNLCHNFISHINEVTRNKTLDLVWRAFHGCMYIVIGGMYSANKFVS